MSKSEGAKDTRSLLKNSAAGIVAQVLTQGAALASAMYLGRQLGPAITAVYGYSFMIVTLVLPLVNFGTDQPLIREVARDRKSAGRLLMSSLALRIPASLAVYCVLLLLLRFGILGFKDGLPPGGHLLMYIVWLTLFTESVAAAVVAVFAGLERQYLSAAIRATYSVLRAGLTIVVVFVSIKMYATANLASMGAVVLILGAVSVFFLLRTLSLTSSIQYKVDFRATAMMASAGAWFFAIEICQGIINRFGFLYLPAMVSLDQVGRYMYSYRMLEIVIAAALAIDIALFPIITRRCQAGADSLRRAWDAMHKYLAIASVPIAVTFTLLAEEIMLFLFGPKWSGCGPTLSVLIWAAVLYFPMMPSFRILFARNGQMRLLPIYVIDAVVNIGLNLALVPYYGILGSAISLVAMQLMHFALCFAFPFRTVEIFPILKWYVKPVCAGVVMAVAVYVLRERWHVMAVGAGGLLVYVVALFALKTFSAGDAEMFRGALSRGKVEQEEPPVPTAPGG